jgi:hypothetical protein
MTKSIKRGNLKIGAGLQYLDLVTKHNKSAMT